MKKNRTVFIDTSTHFAIANAKDVDHKAANKFLKELGQDKVTLLVTNFIIDETYTLMLRKLGREKAIDYIEALYKSTEIVRISEDDEKRAWKIILRQEDKDFSYTDATSFAVMERLGIKEAFAVDKHFEQYGFVRLPA